MRIGILTLMILFLSAPGEAGECVCCPDCTVEADKGVECVQPLPGQFHCTAGTELARLAAYTLRLESENRELRREIGWLHDRECHPAPAPVPPTPAPAPASYPWRYRAGVGPTITDAGYLLSLGASKRRHSGRSYGVEAVYGRFDHDPVSGYIADKWWLVQTKGCAMGTVQNCSTSESHFGVMATVEWGK